MIGLIPKPELELIEPPWNTSLENRLEKIVEVLQQGDGHFVLANDSHNNWIAYVTLDQDADEVDHRGLGTGNSAYEAIDSMLEG